MQTKLVAIVGMCGSGKSVVSDAFVASGFSYLRFGQITLDEVARRGLKPTDSTAAMEKEIREDFRKKYGMAAFALLNIPKFDELLLKGNVIGDGLYSWSEYKVLKEKYGDRFSVIAVLAPPRVRYGRLESRIKSVASDTTFRYRSFTPEEAKQRDYSEIENIEKGGPIAMADYFITNTSSLEYLHEQTEDIIKEILG